MTASSRGGACGAGGADEMVTRALDVVLFGPPGAGKGTQAKRVAAAWGISHVSTGDLLREEVKRGSRLGAEAQEFMRRGELVPDELVVRMLTALLHQQHASAGCVFDGYPRTVAQARLLEGLLSELNRRVDIVVVLKVGDEQLIERIAGRRTCSACGVAFHVASMPPRQAGVCDTCGGELVQRPDDREDVVRERLRVYRAQTAPLLELFVGRKIVREIDGEGSVEDVFARIRTAMGRHHS